MPFEAIRQGLADLGAGIGQGIRTGTAEKDRTFWASVADARKTADDNAAIARENAVHIRNRTEALSDLDKQQKFARQNEYLNNALEHIDKSMELVQADPQHFKDPQATLEKLKAQRIAMAADPTKAIDWTPLQDVTDAVASRNKMLTDIAATKASHEWQAQQANIAKDLATADSKENNPHYIVNAISGDKIAMNEKDINRQIKAISATLAEHARGKGNMMAYGLPEEDVQLQKEKQSYIDALRGPSYGKDAAETLTISENQDRVTARGGFRGFIPNPPPPPIYQIPGVTPVVATPPVTDQNVTPPQSNLRPVQLPGPGKSQYIRTPDGDTLIWKPNS